MSIYLIRNGAGVNPKFHLISGRFFDKHIHILREQVYGTFKDTRGG